jgi:uncharacterized protein YehS (DUF1456 family)
MNHNDVLRRVRFALRIDDIAAINIFKLVDYDMEIEYLKANMRKEEEPGFLPCRDKIMGLFLDGLIIKMRGAQPGKKPIPLEKGQFLSNNDILRKLRIALSFRDDDMLEVMKLGDFYMSKGEMSAFFRQPDHRNFKPCGDQVLRYFLLGLARKLRPDLETYQPNGKPSKVNSPAMKKMLKKTSPVKRQSTSMSADGQHKPDEASVSKSKKDSPWKTAGKNTQPKTKG